MASRSSETEAERAAERESTSNSESGASHSVFAAGTAGTSYEGEATWEVVLLLFRLLLAFS